MDMLKSMRCLSFAALAVGLLASPSEAQRVPGRDLLHYPIGTLAEAPGLALDTGDGFQNPASIQLPPGTRVRGTAIALNTGTDRGVSAQLASVAVALPERITVALSAVHAAINGIGRTVVDPQPIGRDVAYNTFVLSLSGARRSLQHVTSGVAVRFRSGEIDGRRRSTFGLDGGVVAERILGYDARVGISSYLWTPGSGGSEEASFSGAVDAKIFGPDSTRQARAGYGYTVADAGGGGHYVFVSGRLARWVARAGVARTDAFGHAETTLRLGLGVRYARYTVGLSREESAGGFDPTYQVVLSGIFR
jgi:hypothetical protein